MLGESATLQYWMIFPHHGIPGERNYKKIQKNEPDIELIEIWEASKEKETDLHDKFKSKRLRGEWFSLNLNDVNLIYEIMNNQ